MLSAKIASAKNRTVNFTRRHRTAITVAATTAVCFTLHCRVMNDVNEFLEQENLTEKFYNPENEI